MNYFLSSASGTLNNAIPLKVGVHNLLKELGLYLYMSDEICIKHRFPAFLAAFLTLFSLQAWSHSRYIVPSHTSLSSEQGNYISFDLSISEDAFHADVAMGGTPLVNPIPIMQEPAKTEQQKTREQRFVDTRIDVTAPDGSIYSDSQITHVGRKSVAGFKPMMMGTYRVDVQGKPLMFTTYEMPTGKKGRVFGDKTDAGIPPEANQLKTTQMISHVETYVTRGSVSTAALQPTGVGIEIDPSVSAHPNDLFVGDVARIGFLLNGQPLGQELSVHVIRGGVRYRNAREELIFKTDAKGEVEIDWPVAGMYLLETSLQTSSDEGDIDYTRYSYTVSFEVFP